MSLLITDGRRFKFDGYKKITNRNFLKSWEQSSTLYVKVSSWDEEDVIGLGVMNIKLQIF